MDITDFVDKYYDLTLDQLDITELLAEIIEIARRHRSKIPAELVLLSRALITIEGVGHILDPDIKIMSEAEQYIEKIIAQRYSPKSVSERLVKHASNLIEFLEVSPGAAIDLIDKLRKGKLKVDIDRTTLEELEREIDRSSNRTAFSVIVAALLVSSSLIVQADIPPHIFGVPAIGIVGYTAAGFMGLWLLFAIMRSGRL